MAAIDQLGTTEAQTYHVEMAKMGTSAERSVSDKAASIPVRPGQCQLGHLWSGEGHQQVERGPDHAPLNPPGSAVLWRYGCQADSLRSSGP
jgi:hypothetical protein